MSINKKISKDKKDKDLIDTGNNASISEDNHLKSRSHSQDTFDLNFGSNSFLKLYKKRETIQFRIMRDNCPDMKK